MKVESMRNSCIFSFVDRFYHLRILIFSGRFFRTAAAFDRKEFFSFFFHSSLTRKKFLTDPFFCCGYKGEEALFFYIYICFSNRKWKGFPFRSDTFFSSSKSFVAISFRWIERERGRKFYQSSLYWNQRNYWEAKKEEKCI